MESKTFFRPFDLNRRAEDGMLMLQKKHLIQHPCLTGLMQQQDKHDWV
jgi:hypothetical protein